MLFGSLWIKYLVISFCFYLLELSFWKHPLLRTILFIFNWLIGWLIDSFSCTVAFLVGFLCHYFPLASGLTCLVEWWSRVAKQSSSRQLLLGFLSVIAPLSCFYEDGNDLRQNIIGNRLIVKCPGLLILHWAITSVSEQRQWYSWHARLSGSNTEIAKIETYIARKFSACCMTCFVFHFWMCTAPLWRCQGEEARRSEWN